MEAEYAQLRIKSSRQFMLIKKYKHREATRERAKQVMGDICLTS